MDAVVIGSIITIVGSIIVLVFLVYKIKTLMDQDAKKNQQK